MTTVIFAVSDEDKGTPSWLDVAVLCEFFARERNRVVNRCIPARG